MLWEGKQFLLYMWHPSYYSCYKSCDTSWIRKGRKIVCLMLFNATFNNISVISWRSVLSVEETEWHGVNHRSVTSHWQTYQIMLYTSPWSRFELTTAVVIATDCIGSCKYNYHAITATTDHKTTKDGIDT